MLLSCTPQSLLYLSPHLLPLAPSILSNAKLYCSPVTLIHIIYYNNTIALYDSLSDFLQSSLQRALAIAYDETFILSTVFSIVYVAGLEYLANVSEHQVHILN